MILVWGEGFVGVWVCECSCACLRVCMCTCVCEDNLVISQVCSMFSFKQSFIGQKPTTTAEPGGQSPPTGVCARVSELSPHP